MPATIHVCSKCGIPLKRKAELVLDDHERQIAVEEQTQRAFGECEEGLFYAINVFMPHTKERCRMFQAQNKAVAQINSASKIIKIVSRFISKLKPMPANRHTVKDSDIEEMKNDIGKAVCEIME